VVRAARHKYIESDQVGFYSEAIDLILTEFLEPFMSEEIESTWGSQNWRYEELLLGEETNALLQANLALLKTLFNKYIQKRERYRAGEFTLEDALKMIKDADSPISHTEVKQMFALSKNSIVINDYEEAGQYQLRKLNWLEFLEFFCRVAFFRFVDSEMEGLPLAKKLEFLMDDVFPACLGAERVSQIEEELISESDEDY
jgi:hypothetical protein